MQSGDSGDGDDDDELSGVIKLVFCSSVKYGTCISYPIVS